MITLQELQRLAKGHGTPLFVMDHDELRKNYATFRKHLPRIQAYYAVKANPDPAIVKTLFDAGASFDVASMPEFKIVYENIKNMQMITEPAFISLTISSVTTMGERPSVVCNAAMTTLAVLSDLSNTLG